MMTFVKGNLVIVQEWLCNGFAVIVINDCCRFVMCRVDFKTYEKCFAADTNCSGI